MQALPGNYMDGFLVLIICSIDCLSFMNTYNIAIRVPLCFRSPFSAWHSLVWPKWDRKIHAYSGDVQ